MRELLSVNLELVVVAELYLIMEVMVVDNSLEAKEYLELNCWPFKPKLVVV